MSAINFITSNWDNITAVSLLVGGWLWKKAHHEKTESLQDMLLKLGRQQLPRLLASTKLYDDAWVNAEIRKGILAGITRLNVPVNKTTTVLVDWAVEHIHDELAQKVMEYNLGKLEAPLQGALDAAKAGA